MIENNFVMLVTHLKSLVQHRWHDTRNSKLDTQNLVAKCKPSHLLAI
jgi:hypothetical protein